MTDYRNRIISYELVDSRDILDHPGNWREHGAAQVSALRGVLSEVGQAGALLLYHSPRQGGALVSIDGHLRKNAAPQKWPSLILDVTDEEADYILSTHDPLAAMATADAGALDALLSSVNSGEAAVQAMLSQLAARSGLYEFDPSEEWVGMPEFEQEDADGVHAVKVYFATEEAIDEFARLMEQTVNMKTKSIWYPKLEDLDLKKYVAHES